MKKVILIGEDEIKTVMTFPEVKTRNLSDAWNSTGTVMRTGLSQLLLAVEGVFVVKLTTHTLIGLSLVNSSRGREIVDLTRIASWGEDRSSMSWFDPSRKE